MSVDRLLTIARGAVGLSSDDAVFRALCGPGETEARQRELASLSTCALFLRGCLARAVHNDVLDVPGAILPCLWAPYRMGRAVSDLVETCQSWRVGDDLDLDSARFLLLPGAIVIVGESGHEHVYLVESIERDGWPDGSVELTAIEAGQVDDRVRQCVRRKRHEIDVRGVDVAMARAVPARGGADVWIGEAAQPRPVAWVLDPRALLGGA